MTDKENIPPQNTDAEASVLGSILLEGELADTALDELSGADFYRVANGTILEAMRRVRASGGAVDPVTVVNELESKDELNSVGGASYLAELSSKVPSTSNFDNYLSIVKEKSLLRKLLFAGREITKQATLEKGKAIELADEAQKAILGITEDAANNDFAPPSQMLSGFLDRLDGSDPLGRSAITGYPSLDAILGGFYPTDLVVLAARPSMGKTCLAMNLAQRVAEQGQTVGFVSLEMSEQQLVERLIAMEARVDSWKFRRNHEFSEQEIAKISNAVSKIEGLPFFVEDTPSASVASIRASARRLKAKHGLGLLVIDYLQLITPSKHKDSRVQEVSEMTRSLKQLAKELEVPVLILSQLSRGVEMRSDQRPQLHDLRDSGSIEQDADVVMFIYRDDYYRQLDAGNERKNVAEISVKKHRNGAVGTAELLFDAETQRFSPVPKTQTQTSVFGS